MILVCESCGENRRHYERFIGRIDTLEERRELVCSECDAITLVSACGGRCRPPHAGFQLRRRVAV